MTKKHKGEVKVSVQGNPFAYNEENAWNFGVHKVDEMHVDWDIKRILELLKKLGGKG